MMKDKHMKNNENQPQTEKRPSDYKPEDRRDRFQWNEGDVTIIKEEKLSPIKKGK